MILRLFKICVFLTSFMLLAGFVPITTVIGPAVTVVSSGNLAKATAQFFFDNEFKKKTGKSSLVYIKEEVSKNNIQNDINIELRELVKKRVKIAQQKIADQNKIDKNFKLLVEKRIRLTKKKLDLQNINQ